jgi:hypothetical protein
MTPQFPVAKRPLFQRKQNLGTHLPMKIDEAILDACVEFMPLFLLRKRLRESTICLLRLVFAVGTIPACQFLRPRRN